MEGKMAINNIFGTTIDLLGKTMDLRVRNHNLIAGNLANAETPGYTPTALSFKDELRQALKGANRGATPAVTHPRHIPLGNSGQGIDGVQGKVVETPARTAGKDGNRVELENEMGRMAENQIMYNATVQFLGKKFEGLKNAIRENK
jgi:flagellar basal-body rod protein FlgB